MKASKKKRLQALVSRLCDGDVAAGEIGELSTLLAGDEDAINEYLDYTSIHLHLGHRLRPACSPREQIEPEAMGSVKADATIARFAAGSSAATAKSLPRAVLVALAAALLLVAALVTRANRSWPQFTARIVQKIDCDWDEERWGTPQSADLQVGREIELERGLMILEFGNGAEVTLEAPVQFRVLAKDRGALEFGKLTAFVPQHARGFAVQIPAGEVVDLGTRFGVKVDHEGSCETHVFDGHVVVRSDLGVPGQPPQEWKLAAAAALRLSTVSQEIERLAAQPALFINASQVTADVAAPEQPPFTLPADSQLVLWLDAARELQLDANRRVIRWGDLCLAENTGADNAWQIDAERRPRWKKDSLGGRPAIRFDGATFLVTTPFLSGDNVTVFSVLQGRPQHLPNRRRGQLLNLNAQPGFILEMTRENHLAAVLVSRVLNAAERRTVLLENPLPTEEAPLVCAVTYCHASNRCELYLDGQRVAVSQAPAISANRAPKYIGKSAQGDAGFVGDVAEMLVFNSVLSPAQCQELSLVFMKKYGIAAEDREPRVLSGLIPEDP